MKLYNYYFISSWPHIYNLIHTDKESWKLLRTLNPTRLEIFQLGNPKNSTSHPSKFPLLLKWKTMSSFSLWELENIYIDTTNT